MSEFTLAFAVAYDWLYDQWTPDQREAIKWSIITLGLEKGLSAYDETAFWVSVNGNWNCVSRADYGATLALLIDLSLFNAQVCNNGLIAGALAITGDDTTNSASRMLEQAVPNIVANCAQGPSPDGTWSETPNYVSSSGVALEMLDC